MTCRAAEPYRRVMDDELATHYGDLLSGIYGRVDRIVLTPTSRSTTVRTASGSGGGCTTTATNTSTMPT